MRRLACALVAIGVLAAPASAGTRTVAVKDDVYAPTSMTVRKGATVKWVWQGKHKHDVAVARGPVYFRSSPMRDGTFSKRFRKRGTYRLVCTIHAPEMKMTVVVR